MTVINRNSANPIYTTIALALLGNMRVGQICTVTNNLTDDGIQLNYEVQANGSGGLAMANGNELVTLKQAQVASVANLFGLTGVAGQQISVGEYNAGTGLGAFDATYDSTVVRTAHNGINIFSPARDLDAEGAAYRNTVADTDTGCWIMTSGVLSYTLTVQVPSDYASMQDAIDDLSHLVPLPNRKIIINIESGHAPTSGISVFSQDYSYFEVRSTDAIVTLSASFTSDTDILLCDNATAPVMNCKFDAAGSNAARGFVYDNASKGFIEEDAGVSNITNLASGLASSGSGLFVYRSSNVSANKSVFTGCANHNAHISINGTCNLELADVSAGTGARNVYATRGAIVYLGGANAGGAINGDGVTCIRSRVVMVPISTQPTVVSNCAVNNVTVAEGGILSAAERSAVVNDFSGAGTNNLIVEEGSIATVNGADLSGAGLHGILAQKAGIVDASNSDVSGATDTGVFASGAATIEFSDGIATGCGGEGIRAQRGSTINAYNADASGCDIGVLATEGSTINITSGDATGYTTYGMRATNGSTISATSADAQKSGGDLTSDFSVDNGSHVNKVSAAGGVSQTVNTLTSNGIIYS